MSSPNCWPRERCPFHPPTIIVLVISAIAILLPATAAYGGVGVSNHSPGDVYPSIVEMAVGGSVNITCTMNPAVLLGRNASDLRFINTNTGAAVPDDSMLVLNATTAVYMLRDAVEQATVYLCKCGAAAIMNVKVYVGTEPREVVDFKCRNYDFQVMLCNFTQPPNELLTQYNVSYHLNSPNYSFLSNCNYAGRPRVVCNATLTERSRSHLEHFELHFVVHARNALGSRRQTFTFDVLDITIPGEVSDVAQAISETTITTDSLELTWRMPNLELYRRRGLQYQVWVQPDQMADQDYALDGERATVRRHSHNELRLRLQSLPYAFYSYVVRVRARVEPPPVRSPGGGLDDDLNQLDLDDGLIDMDDEDEEGGTFEAEEQQNLRRTSRQPPSARALDIANDDDLWSEMLVYRFRTEARLPDRPPRIAAGSFYVISTETQVRLYWEHLADYERNGANFTYAITAVWRDGQPISLEAPRLELNSALFDWQMTSAYRFEIHSQNHLGNSEQAAYIDIPAQGTAAAMTRHTPPAIHNVYHAANRSLTLTWEAPPQRAGLRDYTVYWCLSKPALRYECTGFIHFRQVPLNVRQFTTADEGGGDGGTAQTDDYNFAVSANYDDYNTGMHWTPCTTDVNSELVKMKPDVQATSAYALQVQWSSDWICQSILRGYNITICELPHLSGHAEGDADNIAARDDEDALESACRIINVEKNAKKYDIGGLRPYTVYSVQMLMYSALKVGKLSEPIARRTSEAAPTPPRQLAQQQRRRNSLTVSWLPPAVANGVVRGYFITCKDHNTQQEHRQQIHLPTNGTLGRAAAIMAESGGYRIDRRFVYTLYNLTAYTNYTVRVSAYTNYSMHGSTFTIDESPPSEELIVSTRMGMPDPPGAPTASRHNDTFVWSAPKSPAGRVDFYEVAATQWHLDTVQRRRVSIVVAGGGGEQAASCVLRVPACPDKYHKFVLEVRAVNAAELATEVDDEEELEGNIATTHIGTNVEPEANYIGNDDLHCRGQFSEAAVLAYRNASLYRLYRSAWQHGQTDNCTAVGAGSLILFVVGILSVAGLVIGLSCAARRKLIKMSSIQCTLPPDLDIRLAKEAAGGGGGGAGNGSLYQPPTAAFIHAAALRSAEQGGQTTATALHTNNEKHRLLSFVGNDSGYLGESVAGVSPESSNFSANGGVGTGESNNVLGSGFHRYPSHSNSSTDSLVTSSTPGPLLYEEEEEEGDELGHEEDMSSGCCGSGGENESDELAETPPVGGALTLTSNGGGGGYVNPANWQSSRTAPTAAPAGGGYVDVNSICQRAAPSAVGAPPPAVSGGGYVQPNQLQTFFAPRHSNSHVMNKPTPPAKSANLSTFSGYVTPEQLLHHPAASAEPERPKAKPMDGYVTQRELSTFGYRQQQPQAHH